ncbi:MAG: iron-containing alcohol dehydrogenase [Deltaproteobacteria bacterium]|nr:iron-containing alcohol dehydrogenase [Deltaproteobacteria bacterium]MBK8239850.1 iron-containing alcohol dehydrogenase [Deltaproteobacteria bacterium]MBK8716175.1 iron-containing alcohol dehydrogenase [Deltaproteobacteria bacterium]MBP7289465.1 iron-containing alcohol dehydrogenase [Nannocystaceae bacterium]
MKTLASPRGNSNYPTAYRIGCGRISELPAACSEWGWRSPMVVTDPGIVKLAWFDDLLKRLREQGLSPTVWHDVDPNPTQANVDAGVAAYRSGGHDGIVLVGGGSAMDAGKCIALLAHNEGGVFDYEDIGDNWKRADPDKIVRTIAVPTTAGTGSEVGRASVIVDPRDHGKKIIFHARMQPALVIADPELTFGLPPGLTAATGMDALAHCFEAYCAPGYHPFADGVALEGMRLIHENLIPAFQNGHDAVARTHMLAASAMGATAFQKGLGLVHALSHPLGGATGLHHGTANAIFLPYVMVFNRNQIEQRMERLARLLALPRPPGGDGFDGVMQWMLSLRAELGLPHTLQGQPGITPDLLRSLVPQALADPSMSGNPRPANAAEVEAVFLKSYAGDLGP